MGPRHTARRAALQTLLFAAAVILVFLTRGGDRWDPWPLLVITVFTVGGELLAVRVGVEGTWLSASFLGVVLTAVLYGGGFAAALGAIVICGGWLHSREAAWKLRNNVVNCVWSSLLAGLAFAGLRQLSGVGPGDLSFYLLILPVCAVALTLNIVGVAICIRGGDGMGAVREAALAMVRPLLAAELFSALLTIAAVWVTLHLHLVGLVMFGVVLASFQYLVGALLTSQHRSDQLQQVAVTDGLTGLGNREHFRLALESRIAAGERFPVLLMDLDRFKEVNDTLGHVYGDRLLKDLGPRLQAAVGARGLIARLGGDEFGILLGDDADDDADDDPATIEAAVSRLLGAVAQPFAVDELSLEVGGSIGVARFPADARDSHGLLRCADIAMYAAKEAQADYKLYAAEQNQHSLRRLRVLSDIRRALAGDEIVVHFQPIVDLEHRHVTGAEGLVRWEHPEHGLIPPGGFVQTVEQSGLIGPLTRRVLDQAIAQCGR
jgi:diguanylate cyclase (GGDEF)-like protein